MIKVAGIAGGVGTTVLATIIGGEDIGRDVERADIIVARNDFRSAHALVELHPPADQRLVLICEPGRALTVEDFEACVGREFIVIDADPSVARSDDAGILTANPTRKPIARIIKALAS